MFARVLLVACAAVLVALGGARAREHGACDHARRDAFAIGVRRLPAGEAPAAARRLARDCRGGDALAYGVVSLVGAGASGPAAGLARTAVRREPDRRNAWLALAAALRARGDDPGAARALARAHELDPLGVRR